MTDPEKQEIVKNLEEGLLDFSCKHCGYNLRGLAGGVKICPECACRNSVVLEDVTEREIARQQKQIEGRIFSAAMVALVEFIVVLVVIAGMAYSGEVRSFCCGVVVLVLLVEFIFFFSICLEPLREIFPPDRFRAIVTSFEEMAIAIGVMQMIILVLLIGMFCRYAYNSKVTPFWLSLLAGVVAGLFCLFIVIRRTIRSTKKVAREEREAIKRESAIRLAIEDRWKHIYRRVGATSSKLWKETD